MLTKRFSELNTKGRETHGQNERLFYDSVDALFPAAVEKWLQRQIAALR